MGSIAYMLPGATTIDDCYLLNEEPPPQTRPESQRRPVQSSSFLCGDCVEVLGYLAFVIEEVRSERPTTKDADLPMGAFHHQNLASWMEDYDPYCHLCYFISRHLKWPNDWNPHLSDVQLEFSWDSDCIGAKDPENVRRGRLYLALTRKSFERTLENHKPFLRLQTWPARDYASLFLAFFQPPTQSGPPSSGDAAGDDDNNSGTPHDDGAAGGISDVERADHSHSGSESNFEHDSDRKFGEGSRDGSVEGFEGGNEDQSVDGSDDRDSGSRLVTCTAGSTGSPFSQNLVKMWLARCLENADAEHIECNKIDEHWLPTRLLDVNYTFENRILRLTSRAENPELFESDKRYITLSHCWGKWGSEALPILTSSNKVERRHHGIDEKEVPLTFRDAVEVARWFQVRWLWIDSFCIIQDSHQDWQHESSLMRKVYKCGLLNIAASTAIDARGGLFKPRLTHALRPLQLYMPGLDEMFYMTIDERNMFGWMETDPLSQRAWVFQERHLARRILYFTETEIFWECCAKAPYFASETFTRGAPVKAFNGLSKLQSESVLSQINPSVKEVHGLWEDICQMYSEKHLTQHRDKLIALLGLAKEIQGVLPNDEYIAGMWLSAMPGSLLWDIPAEYGPKPIARLNDVAPSWSWASIDGPLEKDFRYNNAEEKCVSVVDIKSDMELLENLDTSRVKLVLSAYLRRVTIKDNLIVDGVYPHQTFNNEKQLLVHQRSQQFRVGDNFSDVPVVYYSLDSNIKSETTEAYFLPLTWTVNDKDRSSSQMNGLLLSSTSEPKTFKRIGTLRVNGYAATVAKYQIRPDVENPAEIWDSFNQRLRHQCSNRYQRSNAARDEATPEAHSRVGTTATANLYDYNWIADNGDLEILKPQNILLQ
ncbi:MAG: hypothetical protein Q9202_006242 [Teloschistes flavicans]